MSHLGTSNTCKFHQEGPSNHTGFSNGQSVQGSMEASLYTTTCLVLQTGYSSTRASRPTSFSSTKLQEERPPAWANLGIKFLAHEETCINGEAACETSRQELLHANSATGIEKLLLPTCLQLCYTTGQSGHAGILQVILQFARRKNKLKGSHQRTNTASFNPPLSLPTRCTKSSICKISRSWRIPGFFKLCNQLWKSESCFNSDHEAHQHDLLFSNSVTGA